MKQVSLILRKIPYLLRYFVIDFLILALAACSYTQPVAQQSMHSYLLSETWATPIINNTNSWKAKKIIFISLPTAADWLSTTKMAYQLRPAEIGYFVTHQWAAPPTILWQSLISRALQETKLYHAVIISSFSGKFDQRLELHLLDMQQQFWQKPSVYHVAIQAQLIDVLQQKILATKVFDATIPASKDDPEGGAAAANKAVAILIPQLAKFCQDYA